MIGCLIGLVILPITIIKWCVTSGIKGFVILGIIAVLIMAGIFFVRSTIQNELTEDQPPLYELNIPGISLAPWVIITNSRTYYATEVERDKNTGDVIMYGYWEVIGGINWVKTEGVMILVVENYGDIRIGKR